MKQQNSINTLPSRLLPQHPKTTPQQTKPTRHNNQKKETGRRSWKTSIPLQPTSGSQEKPHIPSEP
jgi:hypothetical protein